MKDRIKRHWFALTILILLTLFMSAIQLGTVICIENSVSKAFNKDSGLLHYVILLIAFFVFGMAGTYLSEWMTGKLGARFAYELKHDFAQKLMDMKQKDRSQMHSGGVTSLFNFDLDAVTRFIPSGMVHMFQQILMAFIAIVYLVRVNWLLLLISLAIMPGCMFIVNILRKKISQSAKEGMQYSQKANEVAMETVNRIPVVKSYNLQGIMYERIKKSYQGFLNAWIRIHKLFSPMLMLNIIISEFPKVLCITVGSYFALKNRLSIENLVGFVLLLDYVVQPLSTLPEIITSLSKTGAAWERIRSVFEQEEERTDGDKTLEPAPDSRLLELKDVCFGYEQKKQVLRDISFHLDRNEKIALFGPSGCGKSTVFSLICGFYECNQGTMQMYGADYKQLSLDFIRKQISYVSQNVYIMPGTVADNIALGSINKTVSREMIIKAAKAANADSFIQLLPKGYDTVLKENGKNLSGGQRQMISVARAFLKDSPILLLDEATAALDAASEAAITDSIQHLMTNRGAIIITHRLSSIKGVNRVLHMENGRIGMEETYE